VIHIFSTHTQASYSKIPDETDRDTYVIRLQQLFHFREYMEKTLLKSMKSLKEMVLLVGDFNVNAHDSKIMSHVLGSSRTQTLTKKYALPPKFFDRNEYTILCDILSW